MKDSLISAKDTIANTSNVYKDTFLTSSEVELATPSEVIVDTLNVCKNATVTNTEVDLATALINNDIWGMPENLARIVIPAIITIAIFLIGQTIVWYRAQNAKQYETDNYRSIILNWIELIKDSVEKLADSCNKLSSDIKDSQDIHPERFEYTKVLAEKIDDIGIDRFITTFMINSTKPKKDDKRNTMIYNLISQIHFLKSLDSIITNNYNNYQSQIFDLMYEWNAVFMKLDELNLYWTAKIKGQNHSYLSFHLEVDSITNDWRKNAPGQRSTMIHSMNHLISPLIALTTKELAKNIGNEYALNMTSILQQLQIIDLKWRTIIDGNSRLFADLKKSINNSYTSLVIAKQYFEKETEVKNIFEI